MDAASVAGVILGYLGAGFSDVVKLATKDAYAAVKARLITLLDGKTKAVDALEELEKNPDSKLHRDIFEMELKGASIQDFSPLEPLIEKLIEVLKKQQNITQESSQFLNSSEVINIGVQGNQTILGAQNNYFGSPEKKSKGDS
ncbi:hypothetical protein [Hahella sp. HN01]|uniref:hypothetical protein n=1 Tax=Hahella sp. HN01 TaxID=2847262 RepID=UPI001C1EF034|nr:hypothetical protein [Hahella sp. HN01]MBU6954551.1 hypothetical protein [Hahella sp. HN01]